MKWQTEDYLTAKYQGENNQEASKRRDGLDNKSCRLARKRGSITLHQAWLTSMDNSNFASCEPHNYLISLNKSAKHIGQDSLTISGIAAKT